MRKGPQRAKSEQCGNSFSWETCFYRRAQILRFILYGKDPMASFPWPWGLALLLTEGQEVLKLCEVWAIYYRGGENKEKTKAKKG